VLVEEGDQGVPCGRAEHASALASGSQSHRTPACSYLEPLEHLGEVLLNGPGDAIDEAALVAHQRATCSTSSCRVRIADPCGCSWAACQDAEQQLQGELCIERMSLTPLT